MIKAATLFYSGATIPSGVTRPGTNISWAGGRGWLLNSLSLSEDAQFNIIFYAEVDGGGFGPSLEFDPFTASTVLNIVPFDLPAGRFECVLSTGSAGTAIGNMTLKPAND